MTNRAERRRERRSGPGATGSTGRAPWIIGGVVLVGVAIVGWDLVSSLLDDTAREPVELTYETPQELLQLAQGIETGNPSAAVTIFEFADYQCPSCRSFFQNTKPFLDLTYIQQNQIRFVFHDFPLVGTHPHAFLAARAARCAGDQGGYWAYHDRLFQTQQAWSPLADPKGQFGEYAVEVGLDGAAFETCLNGDRHADVVTANMELGNQLGVGSTPTILIDAGEGRAIRVDNWGIESLREVVDAALARLAPMPAGDAPDGAVGAPAAGTTP